MEKKYIDQEAALSAVCASCKTVTEKERELCPYKFTGCNEYYSIFALPAADVREVVKAEWLPIIDANEDGSPYQSGVHCSACGHCEVYEYDFCPNCGADMRGK